MGSIPLFQECIGRLTARSSRVCEPRFREIHIIRVHVPIVTGMTRAPLARPTPFEFYGLVRTLNLINLSKKNQKNYLSRGLPHISEHPRRYCLDFSVRNQRAFDTQKKSKKASNPALVPSNDRTW